MRTRITAPICIAAAAIALAGCANGAGNHGAAQHPATTVAAAQQGTSGAGGSAAGGSSGTAGAGTGSGAAASGGGCANLFASAAVKAAVTDAQRGFSHLQHIQPVPGDFYYGGCGSMHYAGTDFETAPGAGYAEAVGLQDDGSAMQYFASTGGGSWQHLAADGLPRDPRGCAAITAIPAALAALWHGCPLSGNSHGAAIDVGSGPHAYLAGGGWNGREPVYQPTSVVLSGDSTLGLQDMNWAAWGSNEAYGAGTGWVEDCKPNCASGTIHREPVQVTLTGGATVCGHRFFTRLELVWTGTVPPGYLQDSVVANGTPSC